MAQRVRICDIAEELGLSTATVSNVIHGKTKKVSDETVRRVTALLEQRQYIPSMAGILLAQNRSGIIGVFIHDHEKYEGRTLEDFFIASSLNCLSAEIEAAGAFMMVKTAQSAGQIIRFSSMWNMDGVVVIGFCEQDYTALRDHMRIPFVVYDGYVAHPERIVNITIDHFDGGRQMGRHLRELGHEAALCVSDNDICMDLERFRGFCAGFAPGKAELLLIPMQKERRLTFYRAQTEKFRRVSAVFAVSDAYAAELLHVLTEQGFSVPGDLSVAGFADTPVCELVHPALTTIRQDGALRAKRAIESLRALREGKPIPTQLCLPVTLVPRASTGRRNP